MKNNDNLLRISALTVPTDVNKGSMCPSLSLNGFPMCYPLKNHEV
jgi:hypothetical protein